MKKSETVKKKGLLTMILVIFILLNSPANLFATESIPGDSMAGTYTVNISTEPAHVGEVYFSFGDSGPFSYGAWISVSAVRVSDYNFMGFYEDGVLVHDGDYYNFQVTGSRNLVAQYEEPEPFSVIAVSYPVNSGSIGGPHFYHDGDKSDIIGFDVYCSEGVDMYETLVAEALPQPGYNFREWAVVSAFDLLDSIYDPSLELVTELIVGSDPLLEYYLDMHYLETAIAELGLEEPLLVAVFEEATFMVTFKDYDGTVLKTAEVKYGDNAIPPLNLPREGYTFTGWDNSYENVTDNLILTALYEKDTLSEYEKDTITDKLSVIINIQSPNGSFAVGAGEYSYGDKVTIEAVPAVNGKFVQWVQKGAGVISRDSVYTFIITENMEINVIFANNGNGNNKGNQAKNKK